VKVERALEGTYRGRKVHTTHAPTSGPVLLHMLNLMDNYDMEAQGRTPLSVHRSVEAMKCESSLTMWRAGHLMSLYGIVGFAARLVSHLHVGMRINNMRE